MENKEVLVKVEGLSKKFCIDLKTSLWYGVKDLITKLKGDKHERLLRNKEFWALRDINFELRRGECLGLIGHNGAGKSTLLKILNGLINPDAGKVTIKGRVGALIDLAAGFNPILSGRENVYNNGAVLGFTKQEIDEKLQAIIDFSELDKFIDMPVQNYSSGMKVRLGFAVAVQMEPDVLLVDEVLAVGDLGFALKCFKEIDTILPNTALIFVSHNMPTVSRICNQIILLDKGETVYQDTNVGKGIDAYYNRFLSNQKSNVVFTDGRLELTEADIVGVNKVNGIYNIKWGDTIDLNFRVSVKHLKELPYVSLAIYDKEQRGVAEVFPKGQHSNVEVSGEEINYSIQIKNVYLSKGVYDISFTISEDLGLNVFYKVHKVLTIQVEHETKVWTPFLLDASVEEFKC